MSEGGRQDLSRRALLLAAAAGGSVGLAEALGGSDEDGNLFGGKMALSQAYNVAGDLYIGPDSAKSNVSADSGRLYYATDIDVQFHGDGGSWVKQGVGSSTTPVPSVTTEDLRGIADRIIQDTGGSGTGESPATSYSDPWTLDESFLTGFRGTVAIPTGAWETSGLSTDSSLDWDTGPVYFIGTGMWGTRIAHEDGSSPTFKVQSSAGNGGGVKHMTVYGAGKGAGSANIIEDDGSAVDKNYINLMLRYGGGDALHLSNNGKHRLFNLYLENVSGFGLHTPPGQAPHAQMLRVATTDKTGIRWKGHEGILEDFQILNAGDHGLHVTQSRNHISGGHIESPATDGINDTSTNDYSNITIQDAGRWSIRLSGADSTHMQGIRARGSGVNGMLLDGTSSDCYVEFIAESSGQQITFGGSTENNTVYQRGVLASDISNSGVGNLVNGVEYVQGLADGGKQKLARGQALDTTITVMSQDDDVVEMFTLHGNGSTVTQHGIDTTNFGTTEGNDGTVNVYWDGTNSQYEINNEEGGSRDLAVAYDPVPV